MKQVWWRIPLFLQVGAFSDLAWANSVAIRHIGHLRARVTPSLFGVPVKINPHVPNAHG